MVIHDRIDGSKLLQSNYEIIQQQHTKQYTNCRLWIRKKKNKEKL